MKLPIIQVLPLALAISAFQTNLRDSKRYGQKKVVPSTVFSGDVEANTISTNSNLDGPQLSAVNSSSYEWWYFDAVSQDLKSAITIVFYTALASGFGFIPPSTDVTVIGIDFLFPNGTTSSFGLAAGEAEITTVYQGSSADFKGSGAEWHGASDLSRYTVMINSTETGVVGTFELKSLVPAHYACGPAEAGQPMMVAPNVGWSNAIPDAVGDVNFLVHGEKYSFQGSAYHDHNWGSKPFQDDLVLEHWGRGRLGEYSIVWATIVAPDGTQYGTVYVAANERIITASCDLAFFSLTPLYANGVSTNGTLTGFALQVDLGGGQDLEIQVDIAAVAEDAAPLYARWTGSMSGRVNGGNLIQGGTATFEQFDLTS